MRPQLYLAHPRPNRPIRPLLLATLLAALLAVPLAAGCSDEPSGDPDADAGSSDGDDTPIVLIGGASEMGEGFIDWSDGKATAPMIRGIQGGQHIWVSVRARNVSHKKLRMAITAVLEDSGKTVIPGRVEYTSTVGMKDGWLFYEGAQSFVKCPCQVVGRRLRIELEVIDLYGRTAKHEAFITPTWDGGCEFAPAGSCKQQ